MGKKNKNEYLKYAEDVAVDDEIKVGGLLCVVVKVEQVFHQKPDARTRLTMKIVGSTPSVDEVILFVHRKTPINIHK